MVPFLVEGAYGLWKDAEHLASLLVRQDQTEQSTSHTVREPSARTLPKPVSADW